MLKRIIGGVLFLVCVIGLSFEVIKAAQPDTGTCCPETGSLCIIGTTSAQNYYYKSEGPCNKG
jgi:hypothetical protein